MLDTETTGLSAYYDEIIEIGILRVRDNAIVDQYSQLIRPRYEIDAFITELTGITNEMVAGMPSIMEVKDAVLSFIGSDIIVGHNTSFDMRFLNAGFHQKLNNQYMDTMQFARKLYPELKHHRLSDMTEYLGLANNAHRAMADCISTKELYDAQKALMAEKGLKIEDLWAYGSGHGIDISSIVPSTEADKDGFFYGRHVVFTGKLEKMIRKDAMQLVVNLGEVVGEDDDLLDKFFDQSLIKLCDVSFLSGDEILVASSVVRFVAGFLFVALVPFHRTEELRIIKVDWKILQHKTLHF